MPEPTLSPNQIEPRWQPAQLLTGAGVTDATRGWLLDKGSLTRRVVRHCPQSFSVQVLNQAWGVPSASECSALETALDATAWIREVELHCGRTPWVFARTLIPVTSMEGDIRRLADLGNRPLGEVLFSDPKARRGRVEVAELLPSHALFSAASAHLDAAPRSLWARRTLYYMEGRPLLVNEVFLPNLPRST